MVTSLDSGLPPVQKERTVQTKCAQGLNSAQSISGKRSSTQENVSPSRNKPWLLGMDRKETSLFPIPKHGNKGGCGGRLTELMCIIPQGNVPLIASAQ